STTGTTGFRIEGNFRENNQAITAVCILREAGRKEFIVDDSPYERFAQHIGRFPCVMIAPDDIQIISSGSEERRRFFDALMSQLDPEYLRRLISYNKILQQRNSCLKSMAENRIRDPQLLTVYDEQLVPEGEFIHQRRKDFLEGCIELAKTFYRQISAGEEEVDLVYQSQLSSTDFSNLLEGSREKDLHLQRTNTGIHKDDLVLTLNREPFRLMASQGQRKSLLFALKLAEFESLRTTKGFAPLLLLDDVFEKLDEGRMHNLLDQVCVSNGGQIFITDTHQSRIEKHFSRLGLKFQLLNL
ncbi:MAG TPA: DNA replication and repair protein RecF, partial [Flavitalea sp.]|nr:DNA replication and repair protein RecF [Flavitalea sp.]